MNGFPPGFPPGGFPPGGFTPGNGGPFVSPPSPAAQAVPPQGGGGGLPSPNGQSNVQAHYCFSGALWCSGCNPCDACAAAVRQYVLVPALLEEQAALSQNLPLVLQTGQPVDLQLLADTFFRMAAASWKQLHVTMQSMPAPQRPFRVMNVTKVLEAAEVGRQVLVERERAAAVAAATQAAQTAQSSAIPANIPPQNMAQPVSPAASPAGPSAPFSASGTQAAVPQIIPSKPVDFDRAMRAGGEQSVIIVQAEEPESPGRSAAARAPTVTTEDFKQAAGSNGADTKTPS